MPRWLIPLALCAPVLLVLPACDNDHAMPEPGMNKPALPPAPMARPAPAADKPRLPAPASLEGEWRVAGIGDADVNLPHGISASIGRDRIEITSNCVVLGWRYSYVDGQLQTEALPGQGCERMLDHLEKSLLRALTQARGARFTPANGVELYGEGPTVLLFSQ